MTENEIFMKLKKEVSFYADFFKIETCDTEIGVPDIYYSGVGYEGWIELKIIRTKNVIIPYRPAQRKWLKIQKQKHLNAFVLVYFEEVYYLLDDFTKIFKNKEDLRAKSLWHNTCFKNFYFISYLSKNKKRCKKCKK